MTKSRFIESRVESSDEANSTAIISTFDRKIGKRIEVKVIFEPESFKTKLKNFIKCLEK